MNKHFITEKALKNRVLMILIALVTFVYGIYTYTILPRQEYPVVVAPAVIITVVYPGASAEDMENLVSTKVEDVSMKVNGFDSIKTVCNDNVSSSTVLFDLDLPTDELDASIDALRNDILDLKENELPKGVTNIYYSDDISDTSGLILTLTADERSNKELTQRAGELKDKLRNIEGVSNVKVSGDLDNQIEVVVDLNKLNNLNISLAELTEIINYQNTLIPIGNLEYEDDKIEITSSGKLENLDEIKNIIVNIDENGLITKLSDVATVDYAFDEESKSFYYNDKSAVIIDLYYEHGINITKVEKEIQTEIAEFTKTLPKDIELNTAINLADDVRNSVNNFTINLIQSILIVLIVVMVGMSFKNGIIVAVAIPLSISIPFIGMKLLGVDIQFVSLAALIIALGMLVDNAIVVSDSIQVELNKDVEKFEACVVGTKKVAFPVLTSTLTTVVMFAIFFVLPGTMLKFSSSLPTVVIIALFASYVVSLIITPIMCFYFMEKEVKKDDTGFKLKCRLFLRKFVHKTFDHKALTIVIAVLSLVFAIFALVKTDVTFMPKSEKPLVDIKIEVDSKTDIRKTQEMVEKVSEVISKQPETEFYLSTVGGTVPKYDFSTIPLADNINLGSFIVRIDLSESDLTKSQFVENLQNQINAEVGGNVKVTELAVLNNPKSEQIQVRLIGDNVNELDEYGAKILDELNKIEGVRNANLQSEHSQFSYYADYKNDTLNSYGLTKAEVSNEMNIAIMGREASTYRNDTLEYPIIVKSNVTSISDLENLKVKSSITKNKYTLKQFADITLKSNRTDINKYNGENTVVLTAIPQNGYSAIKIQSDLKKQIDKMNLENVKVVYEGDSDIMGEAISKLMQGAIIGVIVILIILYVQFKSIKSSLIIFTSMPFCLVGAMLGIHLFNATFDFYTILGIVSLIGVVVNNAIVLVDYIENERENLDIDSACKEAVSARFRPVILSSATSVLGMLPLAIGGSVLFRGLAIAFMCGLTVSMCFTFIVIPIIYSLFSKEV